MVAIFSRCSLVGAAYCAEEGSAVNAALEPRARPNRATAVPTFRCATFVLMAIPRWGKQQFRLLPTMRSDVSASNKGFPHRYVFWRRECHPPPQSLDQLEGNRTVNVLPRPNPRWLPGCSRPPCERFVPA